jgi:hypothetical protein
MPKRLLCNRVVRRARRRPEGLSPTPCDLAQPPGMPTPVERQPVSPPDTLRPVLLQATLSALCGTPTPIVDPGLSEHTEDVLAALESAFKSVPTL